MQPGWSLALCIFLSLSTGTSQQSPVCVLGVLLCAFSTLLFHNYPLRAPFFCLFFYLFEPQTRSNDDFLTFCVPSISFSSSPSPLLIPS
ncbi:MAG: hypothetical protein BYD32DRAFT_408649 [Podila humilis]|nr:MAG: hypothetical protein BYD32DRAFT_408649 [Podila humilis]